MLQDALTIVLKVVADVVLDVVLGVVFIVKQCLLGIAWRYTELSVAKTQILLSTVTGNCKTYKAHPQLHKGPVNKVTNKKHQNRPSTG